MRSSIPAAPHTLHHPLTRAPQPSTYPAYHQPFPAHPAPCRAPSPPASPPHLLHKPTPSTHTHTKRAQAASSTAEQSEWAEEEQEEFAYDGGGSGSDDDDDDGRWGSMVGADMTGPGGTMRQVLPPGLLEQLAGPSTQQLDEFSALWAEYGRELQLSRETIAMIGSQVSKGVLPCDARTLRLKTLAVLALERKMPEVKPRYLLANSPHTLRVNSRLITASARRLVKLLPSRDLPSLLVTLMPQLKRTPHVDVLVCELLELESVVCPLWGGAAVDPRLAALWLHQRVDYWVREDREHARANHPAKGRAKQEQEGQEGAGGTAQSAWASKAEFASTPEEGDWEAAGPPQPPLDLASIQASCEAWIGLLGREPAYAAVSKAPQVMLRVTPQQARERLGAIQACVRVAPTLASLLVEQQPRLMALTPDQINAQMTSLAISLGWSKAQLSTLVQGCPRALLTSSRVAASQWRRLQAATAARPEWSELVERSPAYCLGLLLSRRDPLQCLSRLDYLAATPRDMPGAPLERVLKITQPAFLQRCPGFYATSWRNQRDGAR